MYVSYVSEHRQNNILGAFGTVWGAFANVSERFGKCWRRLGSFRSVLDRLGAVWNFGCVEHSGSVWERLAGLAG